MRGGGGALIDPHKRALGSEFEPAMHNGVRRPGERLARPTMLIRKGNTMQTCEKCKGDMLWVYGPTTTLVGGVVATLCARCRTEWNKFVSEHPAFKRLCELTCVQGSIVYAGELQHIPAEITGGNIKMRRILKEMRECEATLHEEGLKWIGREG